MHSVEYFTSLQTQRVNEHSSRYSGLEALEHLLCDDVIISESSRDAWMVWMAFLYKAALQASFAEMNAKLISGWLARIKSLLEEARGAGQISKTLDLDREAMSAWAFSAGIGQIGLLQPDALPPLLQRKLISDYLYKLGTAL